MATAIPANHAAFTLEEIALATGGQIVDASPHGGGSRGVGVTSDSRAVTNGSVFVALRGEVHDGHRFARSAVEKGARILIL